MYLSDFTHDSSILQKFDFSPRERSLSNKGNNPNGIAPWGTGDKILGNLPSSIKAQKQNQKNHSNSNKSQFEHGNSLDLIEIPQKGRTNRSTLGKFQKTNKNIKTNQQFHLHMNKIQFRQHDRKMDMQNQNQLFFKVNQKINIKDFTSLDNNFFIRSYFFPNNIKTPNRRGETESSDQKQKHQYKNQKEIQTSAFLAIKSVDLKTKILKNQKMREDSNYPLKNQEFYEKYRTIQVMSSGRKQRKKIGQQLHEKYQLKRSNGQVKKHNETIVSTKQSSRQNCEPFREKNQFIVNEIVKKDKPSQSGEIIAIQPSFTRSPFDEHYLRIEQSPIYKDKMVNPSKQKHLMIAGIKKLKIKNDQQNATYLIQPKTNFKIKHSTITQNYSSRQSDRPYKKTHTKTPIKTFQSNKNHPNRFMVYDQQTQGDRTTFYELKKSVFLLNDTKEKTLTLK